MSSMGPEVLSGSYQRPERVFTNKRTNNPWTWSKLKSMISGSFWPLRPFMGDFVGSNHASLSLKGAQYTICLQTFT